MGDTSKPKAIPNAFLRQGVWYWRVYVPLDLKDQYPGRPDLKGSLNTKSRAEARRLAAQKYAECQQEFENHRAAKRAVEKLKEEQAAAIEREKAFVDSEEFKKVKALVIKMAQQRGMPVDEIPEIEITNDPKNPYVVKERTLNRFDVLDVIRDINQEIDIDSMASSFVKSISVDGDPDYVIPSHLVDRAQQYLKQLIEADKVTLVSVRSMLEGNEQANVSQPEKRNLHVLKLAWIKERNPGPSSINAADTAIKRFIEINGDLEYTAINTEHVRKFKAHLIEMGLRAGSKRRLWSALKTLIERGVKNDILPENPFSRVAFDIQRDAIQVPPFSRQALITLFARLGSGSEYWWLSRLALYTGARLGELMQLTAKDVVKLEEIWCIRITNEGEKRVKNLNSVRNVPIHIQLITDGFIDWAHNRDRLFDRSSHAASTHMRRVIRDAFPHTPALRFHSLRHTFKTAARDAQVSEDVHDRITGHAPTSVGRTYGTHSIAGLKSAIDRVVFGIESE